MTPILTYAAIAVLVLALALLLSRRSQEPASPDLESQREFDRGLWDDAGLCVAEKVFDSTDYYWLREEVGFPELAGILKRSRQQMAIQWLEAVRRSFAELVRTPEAMSAERELASGLRSWKLLWLTLRFQFLLTYAILVVKYFGPYHRLIPFIGWAHTSPEDQH